MSEIVLFEGFGERTIGGNNRKSLCLRGYDYASEGAYFITLVTYKRECILGDVGGEKIRLSKYVDIARDEWFASESIRNELTLFEDEFIIMPNHIHGIVWVFPNHVRATGRSPLHSTWSSSNS